MNTPMKMIDRWLKRMLNEAQEPLNNQIRELDMKLDELQEKIDPQAVIGQAQKTKKEDAPIIIETVNIEKIIVEKIDYENNFGALGIKSLPGSLNIGTNFGTREMGQKSTSGVEGAKSSPPKSSESSSTPDRSEGPSAGPDYSIHARKPRSK